MREHKKVIDTENRKYRLENQARYPQSWPVAGRMASYKAKAEKNPGYERMAEWRYWVRPTIKDNGLGRCPEGFYSYQPGAIGDYLGNVPDVMKRADAYRWHDYTTGYYTNEDYHETIAGGVERIRSSKGTHYVPVTSYSDSDITTYYMSDAVLVPKGAGEEFHKNAMREAAISADGLADGLAEKEREWNEAWAAGNAYMTAGEELLNARKAFKAIRSELKTVTPGNTPAICAAIRSRIAAIVADMSEAKENREKLRDEWSVQWRRELWPAFNDGAGERVIVESRSCN